MSLYSSQLREATQATEFLVLCNAGLMFGDVMLNKRKKIRI